MNYHIAQINLGQIKAALDDSLMAGFVERLEEINTLADRSPGFVWRLQTSDGNATYLRLYDDDRILVNMSISEAIEALKRYVHHTAHAERLRQRHNWVREICGYLCRVVVGSGRHSPGVDEATAHLEKHGPTPVAFTFTKVFSTGR